MSLDISFDMMITECAPIDALIQRFGRINRKRTSLTIGHYKPVYVLAPSEDAKDTLPYEQTVLERSFEILPDGKLLKESSLLYLLDQVYEKIGFLNIDLNAVFANGKWRLKELCHYPKSALLEILDIDSAVCITETDREYYISANKTAQTLCEIPVSYRSIGYSRLDKVNGGMSPFVIPDKAYSPELGLLSDYTKPEYYDVAFKFL